MAGEGGGGGHGGGHEVGSAALALATGEVSVAGAGAAVSGGDEVAVHADAHGAAGFTPGEAGGLEDVVEVLGFGVVFDLGAAGDDETGDFCFLVLEDLGGGLEVFEAAVGAGSDEDLVDGEAFQGGAGGEVHVAELFAEGFAAGLVGFLGGVGDFGGDGEGGFGGGAPGCGGGDLGCVELGFAVECGGGVGVEVAPVGDGVVPGLGFGGVGAVFQPGEGGVVGGYEAGASAGFDAHVAEGHAGFHREGFDGGAGVFEDVAGGACRADLGDDGEDEVFGGDVAGEAVCDGDAEGFGAFLPEGLGGEDVADFAGADSEGEGSEGAVG